MRETDARRRRTSPKGGMRIAASITSPSPFPRRRSPAGRCTASPPRVKRRSVRTWEPFPVAKNTSMSPEWPESTRKRRFGSTSPARCGAPGRSSAGPGRGRSPPRPLPQPVRRRLLERARAANRRSSGAPRPVPIFPPTPGFRFPPSPRTALPWERRSHRTLVSRPGRTRKAHSFRGPLRAGGAEEAGNRSAGAGAVSPRCRHAVLVAVRPRGVRMRYPCWMR